MKNIALFIGSAFLALSITAKAEKKQDLLVKLAPGFSEFQMQGAQIEKITPDWVHVLAPANISIQTIEKNPSVEFVQPNYKIHLLEDYRIQDPLRRAAFAKMLMRTPDAQPATRVDNPPIPTEKANSQGADPLFSKQWGMQDIGVLDAWKTTKGTSDIVVAVIDTGVDYTHEDLAPNLWRNKGEIPDNGIDDDNNGFIDDTIGWDFVSNDNKPYDLAMSPIDILFKGGNPGHGTHCAGNVAARGENGIGIAGVAPNVKIMSLRFISEKGAGTTAEAIKAIHYAVENGAKVMNNSWGSEGEDPADPDNKALKDAIQFAQDRGVLFVAAAGNGHKGVGYDNDNDAAPAYPASYNDDIIISVAALDANNQLGTFSNWGARSVDLGAPGVKVFSTTVENGYSDIVVDKYGVKAFWDGTSMAAPHVAGAAALYWSLHPEKNWRDVKAAVLGSTQPIDALSNKTVTGGKLNVKSLVNY